MGRLRTFSVILLLLGLVCLAVSAPTPEPDENTESPPDGEVANQAGLPGATDSTTAASDSTTSSSSTNISGSTTPKPEKPGVDLIFPRVEKIMSVDCGRDATGLLKAKKCTLVVRTRANTYEIQLDMEKNAADIMPLAEWTGPNSKEFKVYKDNKPIDFKQVEKEAQDYVDKWNNSTKSKGKFLWEESKIDDLIICDAYANYTHESKNNRLCIHGVTINIRQPDADATFYRPSLYLGTQLENYSAPITAAYVYTSGSAKYLFLTDATSRLIVSKMEPVGDNSLPVDLSDTRYFQLSAIPPPIGRHVSAKSTFPVPDNIKRKFEENLDAKFKTSFVTTLTSIYLTYGSENVTIQPDNTLELCISRGYSMYRENGTMQIQCKRDGVWHNKNIDPVNGLPGSGIDKFVPQAFSVLNYNSSRYIHLFYSIETNTVTAQNRYLFCIYSGEYKPNQTIDTARNYMNIGFANDKDVTQKVLDDEGGGCVMLGSTKKLYVGPDDIVAFVSATKAKTIAFWGAVYTVTEYNEPIHGWVNGKKPVPKVLKGLYFRIQAAYSSGGTVYFFTQNDMMIAAKLTMDENDNLTVDWNSKDWWRSETFLYPHFLKGESAGGKSQLEPPFLLGFHELQKDKDDTQPPVLRVDSTTNKPGGGGGGGGGGDGSGTTSKPGGSPSGTKGSTTWIIVLILIIVALILAAIGYLLFIRGGSGDEQVAVGPKSAHKSAARKSPIADPDLMIKTVRSKHSGMGTGKSVTSPGKSPLAGRKSSMKRSPSSKSVAKSKSPMGGPKSKSVVKPPSVVGAQKSAKSPLHSKSAKSNVSKNGHPKSKGHSKKGGLGPKKSSKSQKSPARRP